MAETIKIRKFLKKIIDFFTVSPFVDEDELLQKSLQKRIMQIKEDNSRSLIEGFIVPYLKQQFYHDTNMLMPENQAYETAVNIFITAKKQGRIDELNRIKEEIL